MMLQNLCVFQITEYSVFCFFLTNQYEIQYLGAKGKPWFKVRITMYGFSFPWCTTQEHLTFVHQKYHSGYPPCPSCGWGRSVTPIVNITEKQGDQRQLTVLGLSKPNIQDGTFWKIRIMQDVIQSKHDLLTLASALTT